VLALLARYGIRRAIVHWYAGPTDILFALADQGAFFTVGVEVLFAPHIQTIARTIPADRLLTETDNPDGLEWLTGAPGMPRALEAVVEKVAELRGLTPDHLIRTVGENFMLLIRDDVWLSDLRANILERKGCKAGRTPASEFRERASELQNATRIWEGACE
jgi:TatD DNase family protein